MSQSTDRYASQGVPNCAANVVGGLAHASRQVPDSSDVRLAIEGRASSYSSNCGPADGGTLICGSADVISRTSKADDTVGVELLSALRSSVQLWSPFELSTNKHPSTGPGPVNLGQHPEWPVF